MWQYTKWTHLRMTPKRTKPAILPRLVWGWVAFGLLGSLASRLTGLDPGLIQPIASALTLATFSVAVAMPIARAVGKRRAWVALFGVLVLGAASELCGLYTGLPFGRYEYTQAWQPTLALPDGKHFPVLLPFAWLMVVCAGYLVCAHQLTKRWTALIAALLVTAVDVVMEWAVVVQLDYWNWTDPRWPIGELAWGVPILNFVGWFVIAWLGAEWLNLQGAQRAKSSAIGWTVLTAHAVLMLGLGLISFLPQQPALPLGR